MLGPAVVQPLAGDDIYVVANLRSPNWSERLFPFNYDAPSADYASWWGGRTFQRRFIRVPASALLWLEWKAFRFWAEGYHLVTLALVLASALWGRRIAQRFTSELVATAVALVPAVHPASAEVVGQLNCQPLVVAGVFALASAWAWLRARETGLRRWWIAALGCCALAMTSYEAAVVLPFVLALLDWRLRAGEGAFRIRRRWMGLGAIVLAYVPCAFAIRRGLTAPDTGPMRPWQEVWLSARLDATAYVVKAVGGFDPRFPTRYWVHGAAGEVVAILLAVTLLALVWLSTRGRRAGPLGLLVAAAFLVAPWWTRASVAQLNFPTLRQLYLPVLAGGPMIAAAFLLGNRQRFRMAAFGVLAVVLAIQAVASGGFSPDLVARRQLDRWMREALKDVPDDHTVVGITDDACNLSPSLFRDGPAVLAVPETDGGESPQLQRVDANTVLATTRSTFVIRSNVGLPERRTALDRGPAWIVRRPPPLLSAGWQRIAGATVAIANQDADGIHALRFRFDRPLSELVFVRWNDCESPPVVVALNP